MSALPAISAPVAQRPKLVFFYSSTSGRSRRAEGFIAQVLQRRGNHETFELVRVDADRRPDLVSRFRLAAIPALAVVDDHRVVATLVEPRGCRQITETLSPWLR